MLGSSPSGLNLVILNTHWIWFCDELSYNYFYSIQNRENIPNLCEILIIIILIYLKVILRHILQINEKNPLNILIVSGTNIRRKSEQISNSYAGVCRYPNQNFLTLNSILFIFFTKFKEFFTIRLFYIWCVFTMHRRINTWYYLIFIYIR